MGGDGGVCANDRRFIRGCSGNPEAAARDVEQTAKQQQVVRTHHCALSGERLSEPIAACELGGVYNKEALISALLDRTLNAKFSHIRGLKDIKQLILTPIPGYKEASEVEGELPPRFCCPVTRVEMNGVHPFVVVWTTGHVLSEKALKEVGAGALQVEYGPFAEEDVIRLIPTEDLVPGMRAAMETRRASAAGASSKKKKRSREEASGATVSEGSAAVQDGLQSSERSATTSTSTSTHTASNGDAARVEKVAKAVPQSTPSGPAPHSASLHSGRPSAVSGVHVAAGEALSHVDKKTTDSDVYKKLFHKDAKKMDKDLFMNVAGFRYGLS